MAISTFSRFYFGFTVTAENQNLPFNEGAGQLNAAVDIGTYSLTDFLVAVKTALDAAAVTNTFTVTVNRVTRKITITSDVGAFDLLITTGDTVGTSIFSLMGFSGADVTGAMTYESNGEAGSEYITQHRLQDYVDNLFSQERIDPSVNESASGLLEVVSFGVRKFVEMNLRYITNKVPQDGVVIRGNTTGVTDAITFLEYITTRAPVEFMVDYNDQATFLTLILERTKTSRDGVGFKLNERVNNNLAGYYDTGLLVFRVVT